MAKEFKITSLRLAELEKELNYLKTTREREIAAMIAEDRSYGDLSENSEYDAAKNEQAKLYGRIAEIEDILSHAVIIEDENEATGRVGLGCNVVVEDANGNQTEYRITGSQEANPMERKQTPWSASCPMTPPSAAPSSARVPVSPSPSTHLPVLTP